MEEVVSELHPRQIHSIWPAFSTKLREQFFSSLKARGFEVQSKPAPNMLRDSRLVFYVKIECGDMLEFIK
ncbi:MAG: hypothetical protein MRY21_05715 [Simkaniaceae bacterium]|nr:hypothetical protein [Simkaniaceae bacterium]